MRIIRFAIRALTGIGLATVTAASALSPAFAGVELMPHRAIYDMELGDAEDSSGISGLSGRMVYEFTGGACEGYSVSFRFVTELSNTEGGVRVTDLQTTSFEEGTGKGYQFLTKTFIDRQLAEETRGKAEHTNGAVAIDLMKPSEKKVEIKNKALFPTQHLQALLAAASKGEQVFVADVFDGSETGEKVYYTTSIIGPEREGPGLAQDDAQSAVAKLGKLPHWPVTVSYFEEENADSGEKTPVYQLGFLLYQNGVSRRLVLDYGEFKIRGHLVELEPLEPADCPAAK